MIVYGSSLSPFVRKVLAYGAEKGLALENKIVSPMQPDEDFAACSPFRKIPGFRDGDFRISDSTAIIAYLEAKHPEPPLTPASPEDRARAVWFEEFADTIMVAAGGKMFFNRIVAPRFMGRPGDLELADKAEKEEIPPIFDYLETVVPAAGGFLVGGALTVADLAVASPFANFRHMKTDLSRWPKTKTWAEAMLDRPSFKPLVEMEAGFLA